MPPRDRLKSWEDLLCSSGAVRDPKHRRDRNKRIARLDAGAEIFQRRDSERIREEERKRVVRSFVRKQD